MVSRDDAETTRFLDEVILLVVHANPDGHALVANWYMRNDDPMERSTGNIPVLYNKYAGHDNNRDFYMASLSETENMNRVMYREWFPHIVYNHHQTGPSGTVMFAPPFRDPPNHNLDPIIITRPGPGRLGHAPPHGRRGQGRHHHAARRQLLHLVERRPAHHALLPQHDRPAHRDHREPHPDRDSLPPQPPDHPRRPAATRQPGALALPAVHRLLADGQPGRARLCVTQSRAPALQHLAHGYEFDRAGQPGLLDDPAQMDRPDRRRGERTPLTGGLRPLPARPGEARCPRLRPAGRSARLPHRDPVRERASQERGEGAPGHERLQRGRGRTTPPAHTWSPPRRRSVPT